MKNLAAICLSVATVVALLLTASFQTEAASITWTNSSSGGWNTAANWSPNQVPGANDTAIITNVGVTVSLNGATGAGAIILGTSGPGTVTLSLAGQTLTLNGPLTVNPSGSFTVDGGTLSGYTNAVLSGTIGWTAGMLGGTLTLASGSTLNITTANNHDLPNCTLTNNGTVAWASGTIRGGDDPGTVIYNYGLWDAQSDQTFNDAYADSGTVFNNFGTFRKSGSTGGNTTIATTAFNNTGTIDVQTNSIIFQTDATFRPGSVFNGAGSTILSSGNFNLNGATINSTLQFNGGTIGGTNTLAGTFNWNNGSFIGATLIITIGGTLNIVGDNDHDMPDCTLINNGTVAWASGTIRGGGNPGTVIYNYGLWDAQSDQTFNDAYADSGTVFNNFGTFRKSGGADEGIANATEFQGWCSTSLPACWTCKTAPGLAPIVWTACECMRHGYI